MVGLGLKEDGVLGSVEVLDLVSITLAYRRLDYTTKANLIASEPIENSTGADQVSKY